MVVIVLFAGLLLSGCGGKNGPPSNGVDDMTPTQALRAVKAAVATAKTVHIVGTAIGEGRPLSLDLRLVADRGGAGHVTAGGISFDIVRVGQKAYVKGDRSFWANFTKSTALQGLLAGKWLSAPANTGPLASLTPVTSLTGLTTEILSNRGTLTMGDTAEVGGTPAIAIVDGKTGGKLYVATTGPAYPLKLVAGKGNKGTVTFSAWDLPVPLTAPPNALDFAKVTG